MKGNDNLKKYLKRTEGISSRRVLMTALMALAVLVIGAVLVAGVCLKEQALTTDFTRKNIAPCIQYPFGTDWMGRDSGNGTCLCGRRKMGRQPDQWFY